MEHLYRNEVTVWMVISFYLGGIFQPMFFLLLSYFMYIVAVQPSAKFLQLPPPSQAPCGSSIFNHRHEPVSDVVIFCYLSPFNRSTDELEFN